MASPIITARGISTRQAQAVTDTPVMPDYTLFSPNYLKLQGTSDNGYYVNFSTKYVELQGIGCFFASGRGGGVCVFHAVDFIRCSVGSQVFFGMCCIGGVWPVDILQPALILVVVE